MINYIVIKVILFYLSKKKLKQTLVIGFSKLKNIMAFYKKSQKS